MTLKKIDLFEYDLCQNKYLKEDIITEYHGTLDYPTGSPRETLRMAHSVGLIDDDIWMEILPLRATSNKSVPGIDIVYIPQRSVMKTEFHNRLSQIFYVRRINI